MKDSHPTKARNTTTLTKLPPRRAITKSTPTTPTRRRNNSHNDSNHSPGGAIKFSTSNNLKCYGQQNKVVLSQTTTTTTNGSRRLSPNGKQASERKQNKISTLTNGSSSSSAMPKKQQQNNNDLNDNNDDNNLNDGKDTRDGTTEEVRKSSVTNGSLKNRTTKHKINNNGSSSVSPKRRSKKNGKESPELRPRRRASQTYFFKYQLARNPLKAEEEDLKLALIASLQQCGGNEQQTTATSVNDCLLNSNSNDSTTSALSSKNIKNHAIGCCYHKNAANGASNTTGTCTCKVREVISRRHLLNGHNAKHRNNHRTNIKKKLLSASNCVRSRSVFGGTYRSGGNISNQEQIIAANNSTTNNLFDEEYLNKYKPETEDFLTFICFRINTAQNNNNNPNDTTLKDDITIKTENGYNIDNNNLATISNNNHNDQSNDDYQFRGESPLINRSSMNHNDSHILDKQNKTSTFQTNGLPKPKFTGKITDYFSPSNRRRPTRQSPRLAGSSRRISENDNSNASHSNHNYCNNTAQDNHNLINYQEDMRKASIALEDMAQEIISSKSMNGFHLETIAQNTTTRDTDMISTRSTTGSSELKNSKHLVKGLMTREFAGGFADEEIIFESISDHKL